MLEPVNLQLAHFNIEHSAQISKESIAAAQQTAQGQEVVQESVKRVQMVQANLAAEKTQKVKRKEEDERERRKDGRRQSFAGHVELADEEEPERKPEFNTKESKGKNAGNGFELYA
ncbi:MAG: hypothetical protein LBJ22_04730 [Synergistaceae bacterium]|jgi:hypothetical protein|nr:hypothetical protein [Synergistaceae bacterium]